MTRRAAQAALNPRVLAVFAFCLRVHVSIHLRMCMLDRDGEGLGTLGSIKRRCFQSDRGSSLFTHRVFGRLTFLLNARPPSPPSALWEKQRTGPASSLPPHVAGRSLFIYADEGERPGGGHRGMAAHVRLQLS